MRRISALARRGLQLHHCCFGDSALCVKIRSTCFEGFSCNPKTHATHRLPAVEEHQKSQGKSLGCNLGHASGRTLNTERQMPAPPTRACISGARARPSHNYNAFSERQLGSQHFGSHLSEQQQLASLDAAKSLSVATGHSEQHQAEYAWPWHYSYLPYYHGPQRFGNIVAKLHVYHLPLCKLVTSATGTPR